MHVPRPLRFICWFSTALLVGAVAGHAQLATNSPFLPSGAAGSGSVVTEGAPIELRGVMETRAGMRFCIFDPARKVSAWVKLNEKDHDFVVKTYDANNETVTVRSRRSRTHARDAGGQGRFLWAGYCACALAVAGHADGAQRDHAKRRRQSLSGRRTTSTRGRCRRGAPPPCLARASFTPSGERPAGRRGSSGATRAKSKQTSEQQLRPDAESHPPAELIAGVEKVSCTLAQLE